MAIIPPPNSPDISGEKVFCTTDDSMAEVGNISNGTTLFNGSGLGIVEPLSVADEYLSPKPLTYTYLPLTKLRPVSLVKATAILSSPVLSISELSRTTLI